MMWASVGDGSVVFDSHLQSISTIGIKLHTETGKSIVDPAETVPLTVTITNENGSVVSGLADRIGLDINGTPSNVIFSQIQPANIEPN